MGFHTVRNEEGRLVLIPKRWVEVTNAIGIFSNSDCYEGINALLVRKGFSQSNRLLELNKATIIQMKSLLESSSIKKLE